MDKWGYLDGTLFGHLDGIYQLNIGDDLFVALREILQKDRGNGIPYDSMAPMLSSYYIGRKDTVQRTKAVTNIDSQGNQYTTTIVETEQVPVIECPYTARIEASGTVADVILEIAKMLVANVGYNVDGRLCIEPNNTDAQQLRPACLVELPHHGKRTAQHFLSVPTVGCIQCHYGYGRNAERRAGERLCGKYRRPKRHQCAAHRRQALFGVADILLL